MGGWRGLVGALDALRRDKWTACWLSLLAPGLGQLLAGRASGAPWLAAAAAWAWVGWGLAPTVFRPTEFTPTERAPSKVALSEVAPRAWPRGLAAAAHVVGAAALALASAEHAKRLLEPRAPRRERVVVQSRVTCARRPFPITRGGPSRAPSPGTPVAIDIELVAICPAAELWRRVANWRRFLTLDPFHEPIEARDAEFRGGAEFVLPHNFFGWRVARRGRVLCWREGVGFSFSDLARGAPRHDVFPHVFHVRVAAAPGDATRGKLTIAIRGRWRAKWLPAVLVQAWLRHVCREHARLLTQAL